jgi:hypothetical protein
MMSFEHSPVVAEAKACSVAAAAAADEATAKSARTGTVSGV